MTDHVISNNLVVLGMSTFTGGQTFDGQMIVDLDNTEALLVRQDGDGGDVFIVDTVNSLVQLPGSAVLTIGTNPAASGSVRLSNAGSIVIRNANNNGDIAILVSPQSDEFDLFNNTVPRITLKNAVTTFEQRIFVQQVGTNTASLTVGATMLVDTTNAIIRVGATAGATIRGSNAAAFAAINQAASSTVPTLIPRRDSLTTGIGAAAADRLSFINLGVETVKIIDGGRFAINLPEQVSIGSPNFIDNVQVHITGSFIDDYGGGPTETHKLKITGSQTGDTGRTNRQTSVDVDTAIITQNLSQTINEVGAMFIDAPVLTLGTDTVNIAYTLKVNGNPGDATENYGLLVDSTNPATNLTALTRIGKSFNAGIKLLVGGGVGFENIEGTAQMRLTNVYTPDGLQTEAMLLHVHTTLQATDGTTDHITGAFFQGSLRTQVEADENVANISQVRIDEPNIQDNLTGTGEITNAQSLLITGAPTEGEDNYALRILGGDIQIANSAAFLFRNSANSADLSALSVGPTNFLEIGVSGTPWPRFNIYSANTIFRLGVVSIEVDNSAAFQVKSVTPSEPIFSVDAVNDISRAVGRLTVAANAADHRAETRMQTTFADVATSAGSSVTASGLIPAGSFVIGVTVRVLTTVLGPASFDVGDGTDVDRWGASISIAQNTTTDITDFTTSALTTFPFANDVVLTSTGVDFTSGDVRITVHYTTLVTSLG